MPPHVIISFFSGLVIGGLLVALGVVVGRWQIDPEDSFDAVDVHAAKERGKLEARLNAIHHSSNDHTFGADF